MDQKLCVVCGAISKIKIFGINVCSACKSFYQFWKRQGQYLECAKNQSCEITEIIRSCTFCRWKRWQEKVRFTNDPIALQTPCFVCGRNMLLHHPSGTNYCHACRAFFTRNVGKVLHCVERKKQCVFSRNNQKNCGYCRMKKCLDVGMKAREKVMNSKDAEKCRKVEEITQIIEEFKANQALIRQQIFEGVPMSLFIITQPNISQLTHRLNAWQIFSSHMNQEILNLIYFSKSILSLDQMTVQDQLALTKKTIFKMYLLHVVPVISLKGLVLRNGQCIDFKSLELLYGNKLAKKVLEFSEDVKHLSFYKENLVHVLALMLIPRSQEVQNLITGTIGDLIYIQHKLDILDQIFRGTVVPWLRENQKWIELPEIFGEIFEI